MGRDLERLHITSVPNQIYPFLTDHDHYALYVPYTQILAVYLDFVAAMSSLYLSHSTG